MLRRGNRSLFSQKVAPPPSLHCAANRPLLHLFQLRNSSTSKKKNTTKARSADHGAQPNLRHSAKVYTQQLTQMKKSRPHRRSKPPPQSQAMIPGLTLLAAEQAREQAVEALSAGATASSHGHQGTIITASSLKHNERQLSSSQTVTTTSSSNTVVQTSHASVSFPPEKINKRKHSDPRTAPSAESGGIPDPTPQYLDLSFARPITLPSSRRILIIMDLNGTLLYRPSKKKPFDFVERPHAKRFMQYCLDNFYVAIWSSARPRNVNNMVAQLLTPAQVKQCLVVWARDKFGLSTADYDARVQCYKRLTMLWNEPAVQASHPDARHGGRWDQTNTVLVDDSIEKGRSEPNNILVLPEFEGLSKEKIDVLPQVHDYLNTLCWQQNISSYMRQTPFKLDDCYKLV